MQRGLGTRTPPRAGLKNGGMDPQPAVFLPHKVPADLPPEHQVPADLPPDPTEWEECLRNGWNGMGLDLNECESKTIEKCLQPNDKQLENKKPGFNTNNRIIACGDIHGDYPLLKRILIMNRLAKYTDDGWKWIDFNATLVFTGDLVDFLRHKEKCLSGPAAGEATYSEWKIYMLLSTLYNQGAEIIALWGNHETILMNEKTHLEVYNFRSDLAKRQDDDRMRGSTATFRSSMDPTGRAQLWMPRHNGVYWQLSTLCNGGSRVILRINNWLFMHGGIKREWIRRFLEETPPDHAGGSIEFGDSILEKINQFYIDKLTAGDRTDIDDRVGNGSDSITWYRDLAHHKKSDADVCDTLVTLLAELYGTDIMMRICIGHCPNHEDGANETEHKTMYVMTNDVTSTYNNDELSPYVKKLSLPASLCWYKSDLVKRAGKSPLGDRCPPIPGVSFACVPVEGSYRHPKFVCGESNDCRGKSTHTLGRVFRIDCGMSRGFHYSDLSINGFVNAIRRNHPHLDAESIRRDIVEKTNASQTAQTLEIIPSDDGSEEHVNHVIALSELSRLFDENDFALSPNA